ncbi:ankyrin repeat domain-containing protein [Acidobacteriota bacterium]
MEDNWIGGLIVLTVSTLISIYFFDINKRAKLLKFADKGNLPKVRKLLEKRKAEKMIDKMGANGNRILHYAAGEWKEPDIVEKAIALGADVNIKNLWKRTPLHEAAEANHVDAMKILLDHGADMNSPDYHQVTPLDIVKKKNKKRTLELLDQYKAVKVTRSSGGVNSIARPSIRVALFGAFTKILTKIVRKT